MAPPLQLVTFLKEIRRVFTDQRSGSGHMPPRAASSAARAAGPPPAARADARLGVSAEAVGEETRKDRVPVWHVRA